MTTKNKSWQTLLLWLIVGAFIGGIVGLFWSTSPALAAPPQQTTGTEQPIEILDTKTCQDCHLDIANHWADSAHANAYLDPYFQEKWAALGRPGECLACHTTNYQPALGTFDVEGISCESCHGTVDSEHPPKPVPIKADTEYCGTCHTTTLAEWRQTGHAVSGIGCSSCHDPHSQLPLFEIADDMCINCHQDSMGAYLEDLHVQEGIGCVDCHALVIPPDPIPDDGIVPTGHTFTITPATCIACHTDALHAGFSLPGWERGARITNGERQARPMPTLLEQNRPPDTAVTGLSLEQQVQALEAALASQNVTLIFQAGIVGLVLGGTTAWFVAQNIRAAGRREE